MLTTQAPTGAWQLLPGHKRCRGTLLVTVALFWLAACATGITPVAAPTPQIVQVPVTVEVTSPPVFTERIIAVTPTPSSACAPVSAKETNVVVIGSVLPLSPPGAVATGLVMQASLAVAVDQINSAGGIDGVPIRVQTIDIGASPELAVRAVAQLITQECAIAIIGYFGNGGAQAALDEAGRYGTPVIIAEASDDIDLASRPAHIFRLAPARAMFSDHLSDWLIAVGDYNGDGSRFVVVVAENSAAGATQTAMVTAALDAAGVKSEVLSVDLPTVDFTPVIARIVVKETIPDAVIIRLSGDTALDLQHQLLDNGIGPQRKTLIVTTRAALSASQFWERMGDAGAYTVVMRNGAWPSTVTEMGKTFAAGFRQFFERWPDASAFAAYDAVNLVVDAARRGQSLRPGDLVAALEASDVTLASGQYRFTYGSANPPATEAEAGQWHQWLTPPLLMLQYTAPGQDSAEMAVVWPPLYRTVDTPVVTP